MKESKPAPTSRIRNWPQYTQSLRQRGSLTLWIDESALQAWRAKPDQGLGYGRPLIFSDTAILTALTISQVFGLPLRQAQGFLRSVLLMLGHPELPVPDFTTLCRRRLAMNLPPAISKPATEPMHLVIDSTGLKVYGEGEWKVRQHGYSKRRTWKKLHLIVDAKTHKIAAATLTANDVHDGEMLSPLLKKSLSRSLSLRRTGRMIIAKRMTSWLSVKSGR